MKTWTWRVLSHVAAVVAGIAAGIYALPILTEAAPPTAAQLADVAARAEFSAPIDPSLPGHDLIHWGEGTVSIARDAVALNGRIGPGPDYKLYLAPAMVDDEAAFRKIKSVSLRVGDVDSFHGFIVRLPDGTDPAQYRAIVVWCETFSRFITAARYR